MAQVESYSVRCVGRAPRTRAGRPIVCPANQTLKFPPTYAGNGQGSGKFV